MSLSEYLNLIGRAPLLTGDEEIILGAQVQKMIKILSEKGESELTPSERRSIRIGKKAKDRMVSANLRLVVNVAKKFRPQNHMKMEDILQEGTLGLIRAVEKFDPERGYKFSTYAYWWIRQGITRAGENQENEIRVPAHIVRIARQAADSRYKLLAKNGREPTIAQIAEDINEPDCKKIKYAIAHQLSTFSIDFRSADSEQTPLIELINTDDEALLAEDEENGIKMDLVMMAVNALDEPDKLLIKKKYGIGFEQMSMKELAKEYSLSVQAIRERIIKITNKIRLVVTQFI